jgi:hypothetical protein
MKTSIIIILFCISTLDIYSCECEKEIIKDSTSIINELAKSDYVFTGKVVKVIKDEKEIIGGERIVEFEILKKYKGEYRKETVQVSSNIGGGMCGLYLKNDTEYLVYCYEEDGKIKTNMCMRTVEIQEAEYDIEIIEKLNKK